MSGYRVGRMSRAYIDEAGAGQGTYAELLILKSPTLTLGYDEAVVEDHASLFKRNLKGLIDVGLELEINLKVADTQYMALRDAFLDPDGVIGIALASGVMTDVGEEVFEADWVVTQFPVSKPLNDTETVTVTCKPAANTDFTPQYADVTV